jgi:hypothetical protein
MLHEYPCEYIPQTATTSGNARPGAASPHRGSVGGCADETLGDVLWIDVGSSSDADSERTGERVDEKITKLVLVDFIVRLVL